MVWAGVYYFNVTEIIRICCLKFVTSDKWYLHSDRPLFSSIIRPIRVTSTASKEKNITLAHQWPPVPCSWWECIKTSPSPSAAAVPRGSSMPRSSEIKSKPVWNVILRQLCRTLFIHTFLFLFIFTLPWLNVAWHGSLRSGARSVSVRNPLYSFITLSKQWWYNELAYMGAGIQDSKCAIFMNKENVWRTSKY